MNTALKLKKTVKSVTKIYVNIIYKKELKNPKPPPPKKKPKEKQNNKQNKTN